MGTRYRDYNPEQTFLLPPSPSDWLPQEHLAYFIADTLDTLDLSSFHRRYEGDGRRNRPYHPTMMLKVLVYAYATGVFSSRKIARKIDEDVALRVLAAGNRPDFRTINRFRAEQIEEFKQLFIEIVRLAKRSGLLKLGTLALDGTKVKANASKHKAMSYQRMQEDEVRLVAEIAELIERADLRERIDLERYVDESIGLPTLRDIVAELARPGRDPREQFEAFEFMEGIEDMKDLEPGLMLPGIVTNITAFGAFVDIGVHQDGLLHISQLADRYVKDPNEIVKVAQKLQVRVLSVDMDRKRIALSLRKDSAAVE